MEELIKPIVRVGNSAGVILPKEWLNGQASVKLVHKPYSIKEDALEILSPYLNDTVGIYLVGSYARNEETEKSDIDILAITNKTNKKISKGKYNIVLISRENLEKSMNDNILPLLPMIKEAKTILNSDFIQKYKDIPPTKRNLRWHFDTTESALKMDKIALELQDNFVSDNIIYSLTLRLREAYIVDCLMKNKKPTTKEFISLIKKISGFDESYKSYLRAKNDERTKKIVSLDEAKKMHSYITDKLSEQEKWIRKKRKENKKLGKTERKTFGKNRKLCRKRLQLD